MAKVTVNVSKALGALDKIADKALIKRELLRGALKIENSAKLSILQGQKSGVIYTRGNVSHQASAPGEAPANDSGSLASSITHWEEDDTTVAVGALMPHASHLEYGTRDMEPRPFMTPALEEHKPAIIAAVAAACTEKVK